MKKRQCKILALVFCVSTIFTSIIGNITIANAQDEIKVVLDGKTLEFDVQPQIINGRTMVPMGKIFEEMGTEVDWNDITKTATASNEIVTVIATINDDIILINGTPKKLDVPPQIVDGRTLVPARFVAEALGATVEWNGETKIVDIKSLDFEDIKKNIHTISTKEQGSVKIHNGDKILYTVDGKQASVRTEEKRLNALSWYANKNMAIFNKNREFKLINTYEYDYFKNVGWYTELPIKIFDVSSAEKNRGSNDERDYEKWILKSELESYMLDGWCIGSYEIMFNKNGEKKIVLSTQIEKNEKDGWSTEPFVTMYFKEETPKSVKHTEIKDYIEKGWRTRKSVNIDGVIFKLIINQFGNNNCVDLAVENNSNKILEMPGNIYVSEKVINFASIGIKDYTVKPNEKRSLRYSITEETDLGWSLYMDENTECMFNFKINEKSYGAECTQNGVKVFLDGSVDFENLY